MRRYATAWGFAAGALAMLSFHQPAVALLSAAGHYPVGAFEMRPVGPFGVPSLVSGAFWSGVWGMLFAALLPWLRRQMPLWLTGPLFGATLPTLLLFLAIAPLRGFPIAFGMDADLIASVVLAHAVWGFGIVVLLTGLPPVFGARRGDPALG